MKKIITLSLISIGLVALINCSPKTVKKTTGTKETAVKTENVQQPIQQTTQPQTTAPVITQSPIQHEAVTPETSSGSATNAYNGLTPEQQVEMFKKTNDQRVSKGKTIFESSCKKCHALYPPNSHTAFQWVNIMSSMGPKAKLGEAEYIYVASYLVKNAKN